MSLELLPAEPGSVRCFFADGGIAELRSESILRVSMQKDMHLFGAHFGLAPSAFSPSRTFLLCLCRASFLPVSGAGAKGREELYFRM